MSDGLEQWKSVVGFEDIYEVSDLGRVRSLDRTVVSKGGSVSRVVNGRVLKPGSHYLGYHLVSLCKDGGRKSFYVHHLVLRAFVGPCPDGMECCHGNGSPTNNKLDNLRWDTPKNNELDKEKHGTYQRGEMAGNNILTEAHVLEILQIHSGGNVTLKELGEKYNVHLSTINNIIRGDSWVHIKRPYKPKSKRQDHETPWWLFDLLDLEFSFTVDAAASSHNAKIEGYWTEEIDGLAQDWTDETIFINPPFAVADLRRWVERAWLATRQSGITVVMIVPVKSDQDWWHRFAIKTEIRFIQGRVTFEGNTGTFPGPIAILVFGRNVRPKMVSIKVPRKSKPKRKKQ